MKKKNKILLSIVVIILMLFMSWFVIKNNIYKDHYAFVDYNSVEAIPIESVNNIGYADDGGSIFVQTKLEDGKEFYFYWDGRMRTVTIKDKLFGYTPRHLFVNGRSTESGEPEELSIGGLKEIAIIKGLENWLLKNPNKGKTSYRVSSLIDILKSNNR